MSSPAQPYNYGSNAAAFSTGGSQINSYATSIAQNLPTAIVNGSVSSLTVNTATNTNIPASAFPQGSGLYLIECNGNGNNDLISLARIQITPAGTIAGTGGCFMNNVNPVGAVAGAVSTAPYQILFINGTSPCVFQNIQASIVYSITTTKIANI
jgi:hypothetical protein